MRNFSRPIRRPIYESDHERMRGRNAPVTLDELRLEWPFKWWKNPCRVGIAVAPLDAYRLRDRGEEFEPDLEPNATLWEPVLAEIYAKARSRSGHLIGPLPYPRPPRPNGGVRDCAICGRAFVTGSERGHPIYCSDACHKTATQPARPDRGPPHNNATRAAERAAKRMDRTCAHCGSAFTPKRSTGRFCSLRCRVAAHRATG
jgi:endogenous inhibitor of DNA gyrase (YacG/DUF329 family)